MGQHIKKVSFVHFSMPDLALLPVNLRLETLSRTTLSGTLRCLITPKAERERAGIKFCFWDEGETPRLLQYLSSCPPHVGCSLHAAMCQAFYHQIVVRWEVAGTLKGENLWVCVAVSDDNYSNFRGVLYGKEKKESGVGDACRWVKPTFTTFCTKENNPRLR